ncbi:DUF255 domain-containing protein [Crocinitomix algicola]|uniref:DUF255 domain-containing protein n=1 Tax=Crocinitomix algicola TaxID=1740263 RepID=UPI000872E219|nr:DUF255 domain-containing protein [Crocinitomix algicola]
MKNSIKIILITLFTILFSGCNEPQKEEKFEWLAFTEQVYEKAKEKNKLILLDIGANWCHWCHVMDDSTYSNKTVQSFLTKNFILTKADQDERPDLYAAYRKWGWPATIIMNSKGEDILRLRGYQNPEKFISILKNVILHPEPITQKSIDQSESRLTIKELDELFKGTLDTLKGGYQWSNKSLYLNGINYALNQKSNPILYKWANLSIQNSRNILDTVWGGVYQYSARGNWNNPHYEKLLKYQARYISIFAKHFYNEKDSSSLNNANQIVGYCNRFLKNSTPLFYNSQNSDLVSGVHAENYYALDEQSRLKKGVPSIDNNIYLKENALLIQSFIHLWAATSDTTYLNQARNMVDYIMTHYRSENNLYLRSKKDKGIFSLTDNIEFLKTLNIMTQIFPEHDYLERSHELGKSIISNFKSANGLRSSIGQKAMRSNIVSTANLDAAIALNKLGYLTDNKKIIDFSRSIFNKLDVKALASSAATIPTLIEAKRLFAQEPYQAKLIIDKKIDNTGKTYLRKLILNSTLPVYFKAESIRSMTKENQQFYNEFSLNTLLMCTSTYCSMPITTETELDNFILTLNK